MKNFFIGILIGSGAILPGISSGVLCVAFGIYEKLIDSVLYFFKNTKGNVKFLFPILFGAFIGIVFVGNILKLLLNSFYVPTCFIFIGLILGTLPLLFKKIDTSKISIFHILCFIISFTFSLYLIVLENQNNLFNTSISINYLVFSGFFMSAGIVIPGISKTVILMLLGVYPTYLSAISSLDFTILLPVGFGFVIGSVIFMYIINFCFKHFKPYTYFTIIGFVLGSIFVLYPGLKFNLECYISILLLLVSTFISRKIIN